MYIKKESNKQQLIYGRQPILEALEAGRQFEKLFVQQKSRGEIMKEIWQLAKERQIPVQQIPVGKLNRLVTQNHQGIVGFLSLVPHYEVVDVLGKAYDSGEMPLFVLLDGITDVRNVGAIARTAACTGVHGLILPTKNSAFINADAIKASAGALNHIPICKISSVMKGMQVLKDNGLAIVATGLQTEHYLDKADLTIPICLVFGAEDKGIPKEHLTMADQIVKIPIQGSFDSYNVSVAAGMFLYETMTQRAVEK